jgi:hypothetical protein
MHHFRYLGGCGEAVLNASLGSLLLFENGSTVTVNLSFSRSRVRLDACLEHKAVFSNGRLLRFRAYSPEAVCRGCVSTV